MTATESSTAERPEVRTATFARIVCGIDGGRADPVTVDQAARLSGADGKLEFVCVTFEYGYGATAQASIARPRAEAALERARKQAKELGLLAETRLVEGREAWPKLAEAAAGSDLLVLGSHEGSRTGGMMLGSVATEALHRAALPVLVARPAPGAPFPGDIVLASDGSRASRRAASLTAAIARVHGSRVTIATIDGQEEGATREQLAVEAAEIYTSARVEPTLMIRRGSPRSGLVELVGSLRPSLLVLGSAGRLGLRALGSVSEHVSHHVPCSVLVARPVNSKERKR